MESRQPEENDVIANEGRAVHELAALVLENPKALPEFWEGQRSIEGLVYDSEMIESAYLYVQSIQGQISFDEWSSYFQIEQGLEDSLLKDHKIKGTPDFWYFNQMKDTLYVYDLKYGFGTVEVFENFQLVLYAFLIATQIRHKSSLKTKIEFRIVQPRGYHPDGPIRLWSTAYADLKLLVAKIKSAAEQALGEDPPTNSGAHCRYCLSRHVCPALEGAANTAADYSALSNDQPLKPAEMAIEYRILNAALKPLQYRVDALGVQLLAAIKRGEAVPGFMAKSGPGALAWSKTPPEIAELGGLLGLDLKKPLEVITPTQAGKIGFDLDAFKMVTKRTPSALKLVTDDRDERAKQIFGENQNE